MKAEDEQLNKNYENIIDAARAKIGGLKQIDDDDLRRPENLKTVEEKNRDEEITRLLRNYVSNYEKKIAFNQKHKKVILWFCISILGAFLAGLITFTALVGVNKIIKVEMIVGLISGTLSFVGLFIGVLKIITEYVFPKDEEQYITKIVEDIQKNDLENKKTDLQLYLNHHKNHQ